MTQQPIHNEMTLSELAAQIDAQLTGDGGVTVRGVNTIQDAGEDDVCFLSSVKLAPALKTTRAAAVIVHHIVEECTTAQLVVDSVDRALIAAMTKFAPALTSPSGIHPTAVIDPEATLDATVTVGANACIERGAVIGAGTVIGPGCYVGEHTTIGGGCRLDSHVVVYHHCQIGHGCVILANATIGATGFGYSYIDGRHQLIPHNGGVIIEDGVDIGANTCIDRAKFGHTVIGAGSKIDNLVQIAHNVQIGKLCLIASGVGIAGSTRIGNGVVFGGQSGAADNQTVGDGAIICARAAVTKDIPPGKTIIGMPPQEMKQGLKCMTVFQRLPEMSKTVKELTQKVKKLEAAKDN